MVRGGSRAPERRRGLMCLIEAVAAALPSCREARAVRDRFERALRDLLHAREVELRDGPPILRPPDDVMSIEVCAGDFALGAMDVAFEPGPRAFDPWDRQLLDSARQVAALVLTIDRAQRSGLLTTAGGCRRNGAAPIVGSSLGIRSVRARMERVAATHFTVLIEGPIRR
jgi:hypothetical protein